MRRSAHFIVNTLALKRGGLVKAVRERANALADEGSMTDVRIAILAGQPRLQLDVADLKSEGHLHPSVSAYSILYTLDPSVSDERVPFVVDEGPETVWHPTGGSGREFRCFRDGVYQQYVRLDRNGRVEVVEHFDESRFRYRRDEMDETGSLGRSLAYQPGSSTASVQRFFGHDGKCFLTIWQTPGSPKWGASFFHCDDPKSFATMGELYKFAFERLLDRESAPAIVSEFRENLNNLPRENVDDIVSSIRHPNIVKVMTAHSNHLQPPYVLGSSTSPNWKRAGRSFDAWDQVVLLTNAQKDDLSAEFGHADIMKVIGQVAPQESKEIAEVDPYRIVLVARIHPKKRLDEAMRVFGQVLADEPRARLEVYGFGYKDAEENALGQLIDKLGIKESVRFMPFTNNPAEIYGSALVTLLTSASEGFPLILLESMSHGVPVIAYDSNYGPRDVIENGVNGYLLPFGESQMMAKQVLELMKDGEKRARMSLDSRSTLTRFSKEGYVQRWLEVLNLDPRSSRVSGNAIGPIITSITETKTKEIDFFGNGAAPKKIELLIVERSSGNLVCREGMNNGKWRLFLPEREPGTIMDIYAVISGNESKKRVEFGEMETVTVAGWRSYRTAHGSLSLKRA